MHALPSIILLDDQQLPLHWVLQHNVRSHQKGCLQRNMRITAGNLLLMHTAAWDEQSLQSKKQHSLVYTKTQNAVYLHLKITTWTAQVTRPVLASPNVQPDPPCVTPDMSVHSLTACYGALSCARVSPPFACIQANADIKQPKMLQTDEARRLGAVLTGGAHLVLPAMVPFHAPGHRLHLPAFKQLLPYDNQQRTKQAKQRH
jgi:hypothetical protein